MEKVELFRPVGQLELDLIAENGWKAFPPRLEIQPIFYPVCNERYAAEIAERWNTKDEASGHVGYVLKFSVSAEYLARYEKQVVGASYHEEYWIPAEELGEFNSNIVGTIEIVSRFP